MPKSSSSDSSVPSIRTFQMDASTAGILKSSVNLFRGDVNYTQTLFTMPGRNSDDGLDLSIIVQYQSNINRQAMTWNRDEPTGVLGLGWQFPLSVITCDIGGSPTRGTSRYAIALNGVQSDMVRERERAPLFAMDDALVSQLADGQSVPSSVRAQFVQRGLPLSGSTIVTVIAGSAYPSWLLRDDALEQEFTLEEKEGELLASDGGEAYQLVNYKFWKVLYYRKYERWSVIVESGQIYSFGGGVKPITPLVNVSAGNSIEWGVHWLDAGGVPVWEGNSIVTEGQQQYAQAWHLQRAYSRFGEFVSYGYNEFPRGANGLLPEVEQQVGQGGKAYTKACYLTSVTDVFGRKASFAYASKLWSNASPGSPREYADPHKSVPDNTPNGFQDRYETRYLESITVSHSDGSALFSIAFIYNSNPASPGAEAVGNVSPAGSGDTCKRLLSGFALRNAAGQSLPGYRFDYYLDLTQANVNLGGLKSITWPSGGRATYTYRAADLAICQRSAPLTPPMPMPTTSTPRVWFGPDYAVVLWHNTGSQQLAMQIKSWNGQWINWQINPQSPLLLDGNGGTSLDTVAVATGQDFVAVTYQISIGTVSQKHLHLFRKVPAQPGQWAPAAIAGGGGGGCNDPTWNWLSSGGDVEVVAGRDFLLATQMSIAQNKGTYDLFTWNWMQQAWAHTSQPVATYAWFVVGTEYYAMVDMSSNVSLSYLSPDGVWKNGGRTSLGFTLRDTASLALAADVSTLAVSHLTSSPLGSHTYDLYLLKWNADYEFAVTKTEAGAGGDLRYAKFSFADQYDPNHPTSWTPSTLANSMVAVSGNLLRFTGQMWLKNDHLKPPSGIQSGEQRYAYGPDYGVMIHVTTGSATAQLVGYDANGAGTTWTDLATPISGLSTPPSNQSTANFASANSADFLVVGTQLFFRGTATNWASSIKNNVGELQNLINQATGSTNRYQVNSASVINEAPGFIACAAYDMQASASGHATAATALVLRNGSVYGKAQMLAGEQMWTSQEGGGFAGKFPGGPQAFFTYPGTASNLNTAGKVLLHRYAGDAIEGAIRVWPVSAITIDDGLSESFTTSYVQDTSTAACDASGQVVKYFRSTTYAGGDGGNPVNGRVECCYLNGNEIATGENYYNALDGMLHSVTVYDAQGALLQSVTNRWTAYDKRAGDPCDPHVLPRQLYGAYVLQTGKDSVDHGVPSTQSANYIRPGLTYPFTGQPVTKSTTITNSGGQSETNTMAYTYACEANPSSRILNDFTSTLSQMAIQAGVTTSMAVTTLASWPTVWGSDVVIPAEEAAFCWSGGPTDFPFSSYQSGAIPDGFECTLRLERYAADGTAVQQADGSGTIASNLYATTLGLPIAAFKGAALPECAWCSFQSYEDFGAMHVEGGSVCIETAWFGTQSLRLPPGASLSPAVEAPAARPYLLGYRYQTPRGYQGNGSPWFNDTQGEWRYVTVPISSLGGPTPAVGQLRLVNQGSADLLLDSLLLIPFGAAVTAQSWYPKTRLLRASMTESGDADFVLYDTFGRSLGSVGADGQLQELDLHFLSRQGSAAGDFDDTSPNTDVTLQTGNGGIAETFRDGGQWASRWRPDSSALWTTADGTLMKSSASPDTLTWQGGTDRLVSAAFFVEITPQAPLYGDLSISFGAGDIIGWGNGGGWYWKSAAGTLVQSPLSSPPEMATQWLLVLTGSYALFFGNGQLLFSHPSTASPAQGCAFSTGPNPIRINHLMFGAEPRVGVSYTDGATRHRQMHQLHGDDSRVMEIVYDALDREIASTRIAPGRFGKGASVPTLQYRSSFLDVSGFLAALRSTCAMQGDIADYYAGQRDGLVVRSNDEKYPYSGLRYEASPQKNVVESGKPGLRLAIHDVEKTTPAQRLTTRTTYTASSANDPVPADQFQAQYALSPAGSQYRQWVDTTDRTVALAQMDPAGNKVGQSRVLLSYSADAGSAGTTAIMQLPNVFTSSPHSQPEKFLREVVQDPSQLVTLYADMDAGETQFLYDGKGQLRFARMPLGPGENHFHYIRYDDLGRILEEGMVNAAWDPEALAAKVDNLAYPSTADGAVPGRIYRYDGDGTDPNNLGQMTEVVTYNPAPASNPALGDWTVTESWRYDALGRAVSSTLRVEGATSLSATVGYHYNNLNQIVQIDLPDGSPIPSIAYGYNDQGQMIAIGVPGDSTAIAAYTWSADGQVETATRGSLFEVWNYDSPGNVVSHQVTVGESCLFSQNFTYTPDGKIEGRDTLNGGETRSVIYTYDGQQRFGAAVVADGKPGNQAVTQYDANGNIWSGSQDGQTLSCTCAPGSNRLASAVMPDGDAVSFHYRGNGNPDQWRGLEVEYDAALGATSAVTQGTTAVRYARGIGNNRILRQQGTSLRISIQGAGDIPLVVWEDGEPKICTWGPIGLAAVHDRTLQYPITDHQQTVWSVADPAGNLLAFYDYLPFGGMIAQRGSAAGRWLFHYCGKEWDPVIGVYDFGSRLYDPALLRFLSVDPQRQYASSYVFSGNDPLNVWDPSGEISVWAQVGIGIGMAALAVAGALISAFSFGLAAPAAAAGEAAIVAGVKVGEKAAVAGAEAVAKVVEKSIARKAAEAAVKVAQNMVAGALMGAGSGGLQYDAKNGQDFKVKQFFKAMGMGALSGAAAAGVTAVPTGLVGGLLEGAKLSEESLVKYGLKPLVQGLSSAAGKEIGALLVDKCSGKPVTALELGLNAAEGFMSGAIGGICSGLAAGYLKNETATVVSNKSFKITTHWVPAIDKTLLVSRVTWQGVLNDYLISAYGSSASQKSMGKYRNDWL